MGVILIFWKGTFLLLLIHNQKRENTLKLIILWKIQLFQSIHHPISRWLFIQQFIVILKYKTTIINGLMHSKKLPSKINQTNHETIPFFNNSPDSNTIHFSHLSIKKQTFKDILVKNTIILMYFHLSRSCFLPLWFDGILRINSHFNLFHNQAEKAHAKIKRFFVCCWCSIHFGSVD